MTFDTAPAAPTPRGRPARVRADTLADVALGLFREGGYDAVTMDEIAAVAGVSRRTLFRYFPSKSALVWDGLEQVSDTVYAVVTGGDERGTLAEAIAAAGHSMLDSLESPELATDLGRRLSRQRLILIGSVPELRAESIARSSPSTRTLTTFIARYAGLAEDDLAVRVAAQALTAASIEAYLYWAEHDDADLEAVLRTGIAIVAGPLG